MNDRHRALRTAAAGLILAALIGGGTGGATMASHHIEGEGADPTPRPTPTPPPIKILIVEPDEHTMLIGGSVRLKASICNENGRKCKPAKKARWSVKPKAVGSAASKRGAETLVTGLKDGTARVIAQQAGLSGKTNITVNEPPRRDGPADATSDLRLYVDPEEATLAVGQMIVLTAWGCPLETAGVSGRAFIQSGGRTGPNGIPDGIDDSCVPVAIESVDLEDGSGLEHVGTYDHAALLHYVAFPGTDASDLEFLGAQTSTSIGGTLPSLRGTREPFDGPGFGDFDFDGDVDGDDIASYFPVGVDLSDGPISVSDELLGADLTGDGLIDGNDTAMHDDLIRLDGNEAFDSWREPLPPADANTE